MQTQSLQRLHFFFFILLNTTYILINDLNFFGDSLISFTKYFFLYFGQLISERYLILAKKRIIIIKYVCYFAVSYNSFVLRSTSTN